MAKSTPLIERNVGGVVGLHVLNEAFSEEIEKALFFNYDLFFPSMNQSGWHFTYEEQHLSGKRCHSVPPMYQRHLPDDVYRLVNLVRNSGLYHEMVTPDYCLGLSYPGKEASGGGSEFKMHFDSRFRWGESVVGVTLGQGCLMHFVKGSEKVKIRIPRRSIYIMTGPSRTEWKHGISKMSTKNLKDFPSYPEWNPLGMRRSLTLRCTKAVSDAFLARELQKTPDDTRIKARLDEQKQYRPQIGSKRMKNSDLVILRKHATQHLAIIDEIKADLCFAE